MVMIWSRVLGDKSLLCMIDCASQCGLSVLCMYDCASAHFGSLSLNSMHGARHWWNFYSTALAWDLELVLSGPQLFPFSEEVNTAALRSAGGVGGGVGGGERGYYPNVLVRLESPAVRSLPTKKPGRLNAMKGLLKNKRKKEQQDVLTYSATTLFVVILTLS